MLLSDRSRVRYANPPVHEVICQLRFPTILTINAVEPADFQEAIREEFPQYSRRQDVPPVMAGQPAAQPVANYSFLSADGRRKINLTRDFIALSTLSYPGWEEFALTLDKPLAAFIRLYRPAFFQRIGLRYVNLLSREKLGLTDCGWAELLTPAYLGPAAETDVTEERLLTCGCDFQLKLDSSCAVKVHAGTGRLKNAAPNAVQDPELKFILDLDLSMNGSTPCGLAAAALETLHGHGTRVFEGAITQRLRAAMEPDC